MLRKIAVVNLVFTALCCTGCVTENQCDVELETITYRDKKTVKNCYLVTAETAGTEKAGRWWMFQRNSSDGPLHAISAKVKRIEPGTIIQQPGNVVALWGPYMSSTPKGWEYWVFHAEYRPETFTHDRLTQMYSRELPMTLRLMPIRNASNRSDEDIVDGARRFTELSHFMEPEKDAAELAKIVYVQLARVQQQTQNAKYKKQAGEILAELREICIKKFAPASENKVEYVASIHNLKLDTTEPITKPISSDTTAKVDLGNKPDRVDIDKESSVKLPKLKPIDIPSSEESKKKPDSKTGPEKIDIGEL